jgi:hypothetical protein
LASKYQIFYVFGKLNQPHMNSARSCENRAFVVILSRDYGAMGYVRKSRAANHFRLLVFA